MKKKIHKINDELENNFSLIGIVSSASGYKLSWTINNLLKINLQLQEDYLLLLKDGSPNFAFYLSENENIKLISNKSDKGILAYKLKNVDYFIKIENSSESIDNKINILKNAKIIQAILSINLQILSKKQNKIFANI